MDIYDIERQRSIKHRFVKRYFELKELDDVRGMDIVKNNFQRVFGYSLCIAGWAYERDIADGDE